MDLLSLYRGNNYKINDHFYVYQPTLGEIEEFGEERYFSVASSICATPTDLAWQLDQCGIDFTQISPYMVFLYFIAPILMKENTKLLFGSEIDFSCMTLCDSTTTGDKILTQHIIRSIETKEEVPSTKEYDFIFDEYSYIQLTQYLRTLHGFEKNELKPGNMGAKLYLIDESRNRVDHNVDKKYKSQLLNLVSAMVNSEGFKHDEKTVFNMKIFPFMDSVKRILKINNAKLLQKSAYSGFGIHFKDIDKNDINILSDL